MNSILVILLLLYVIGFTSQTIVSSDPTFHFPDDADSEESNENPQVEELEEENHNLFDFVQSSMTPLFATWVDTFIPTLNKMENIIIAPAKEGPELHLNMTLNLSSWSPFFVDPLQFQLVKFTVYFNDIAWIQVFLEITDFPSSELPTSSQILLRFVFLNQVDVSASFTEASKTLWSANSNLEDVTKFSISIQDLAYGPRSPFPFPLVQASIDKWYSLLQQVAKQKKISGKLLGFEMLNTLYKHAATGINYLVFNKLTRYLPFDFPLTIPLSSLRLSFTIYQTTDSKPIKVKLFDIQKEGRGQISCSCSESDEVLKALILNSNFNYITSFEFEMNDKKFEYFKNVKFGQLFLKLTELLFD